MVNQANISLTDVGRICDERMKFRYGALADPVVNRLPTLQLQLVAYHATSTLDNKYC